MMHTNGHHSSESGYPALIEGLVEAVNGKGIRVKGSWLNVSQFKPVPLPEVGEYVRLKVDAKSFITSLEVVKAAHDDGVATPAVLSRETRIARLAVLKAAANFLGQMSQTREEVRSEHVLVLADKWLKWVESESAL
jgi:hypothetical protein